MKYLCTIVVSILIVGCTTADAPPTSIPTNTATITSTPTETATATNTPTVTPLPTQTAVPQPTTILTPSPMPVADTVTFERVAQRGGRMQAVAVMGDQAYVTQGGRVVSFDISDPTAPRRMAESEVLGVTQLVVDGERIIASSGERILAIDPATLTVENTVEAGHAISHLALHNDGTLYAAGAALTAIDPATWGIINTVTLMKTPIGIGLTAETLYYLVDLLDEDPAYNSEIYAVHLASLTAVPEPILELSYVNEAIAAANGLLIVPNYDHVTTYDVTDPLNPQADETFSNIGISESLLVVNGKLRSVGFGPAGGYVGRYAERGEGLPDPVAQVSGRLASDGENVYILERGLLVYNGGELIGRSYDTPWINDMDANGNRVYTVDQGYNITPAGGTDAGRLTAYQVPDLTQVAQRIATPPDEENVGIFPGNISAGDGQVYAFALNQFTIFDATILEPLGTLDNIRQPPWHDLDIPTQGTLIATYSDNGITVRDMNDPVNPQTVTLFRMDLTYTNPYAMVFNERWAAVTYLDGSEVILKVSDGENIEQAQVNVAQSLLIDGDVLYVGEGGIWFNGGQSGVTRYTLPDLDPLNSVTLPNVQSMAFHEGLLLALSDQLYALDPVTLEVLGAFPVAGQEVRSVGGDDGASFVVVSGTYSGLTVLEMNQ